MNLNEYQERAMTTCMESSNNDLYAITGLSAEVGEINDKIAKWVRKEWIHFKNDNIVFNLGKIDMDGSWDLLNDLRKEVGDVLWFVALLADRLDITLEDVAKTNLDKLASRKERGVIDGNGDNR